MRQSIKDIQPGYRNGIRHWKMCSAYMHMMKSKNKRNSGKNRTTKGRKYKNGWRKGKH